MVSSTRVECNPFARPVRYSPRIGLARLVQPIRLGRSGLTAPGSTIGSNPVKIIRTDSNGKIRVDCPWFNSVRIWSNYSFEPIRLGKWKIRVDCPWFNYQFKSGPTNHSNRFEPVRSQIPTGSLRYSWDGHGFEWAVQFSTKISNLQHT